MESNGKASAGSGEVIITVEELERRKDRFRKATKEYYEQAERGFRCLHGFCGRSHISRYNNSSSSNDNNDDSHKRNEAPLSRKRKRTMRPLGDNPLRRCRRKRDQKHQVPELEADLAQCLLKSHFAVVELAMQEYLVSIRNLIRPAPSLVRPTMQWQHEQHGTRTTTVTFLEGEGFLLRVPSLSPVSVALPLPIAFDASQSGECLPSRLDRHTSEAAEEQDMAMASVMVAVRESKLTEELAKKIHNGIDSIQVALRKISSLIEANRNNTYFCCHYDCFRSDSEAPFFKPSALRNKIGTSMSGGAACWDRRVVEALKLDGYYRWFRDNNGVLLVQNNKDEIKDGKNGGRSKSSDAIQRTSCDDDEELQEAVVMSAADGGVGNSRRAKKRLCRDIIDFRNAAEYNSCAIGTNHRSSTKTTTVLPYYY